MRFEGGSAVKGKSEAPEGAIVSFIKKAARNIEEFLDVTMSSYSENEVVKISRYLLLNGGHRWRPLVTLAAGTIFEKDAENMLLPSACSIEIVHAATLLLDDLPSMDNAEMRRGKPCAHLVFSPWAVDMASSFLVNMAYLISLDNARVPPHLRVKAALDLGNTAVSLCEGQVDDITLLPNSQKLQEVYNCYKQKTGSLYSAAARIGGILSGATKEEIEVLSICGAKLGLSVQIFDDVADVVTESEISGKLPGKDVGKQTVVDFFGVEGAIAEGKRLQQEARSELDFFIDSAEVLKYLIEVIPQAIVPEQIQMLPVEN